MKNTLKYIGILLLAMVLFTNCQKDNKGNDVKDPGEVSFAVLDGNMDKSDVFDIPCTEDVEAVKARINLNGEFYYPELFMLDGVLYTQSLKLDPGDYTIMEFSLLSADDVVLKSTPMADSHYAQFLDDGYAIGELPTFTIYPFEKNQFDVEVLCYVPTAYNGFGFEWFDITELTVRSQCFFGDFCIKDVDQYAGSDYDDNGVTIDEVAIFRIDLTISGTTESYYNYNNGVYTSPLCIEYADYDNAPDQYLFELYIYVTIGDTWDYVKFYEWTVVDDEMIPAGEDGVVDFVLGNCVYDDPDLLLPPWMNLPTSFDFKVLSGTTTYIRTVLTNIGDGYDIVDGTFHGWCADKFNTIYTNTNYPGTEALSSLYPNMLPGTWPTKWAEIASANWIFNTYPPTDVPAVYTKEEIQDALWILFDTDNGYVSTTVKGPLLAAAAAGHTNYSPLPGGWAAVFYYVGSDGVQMTFDVVDP